MRFCEFKEKFNLIKPIVFCILVLNLVSLISIYSSLHEAGELKNMNIFYKQLTWYIISWLVLLATSFLNYRLYFDLSLIFYIINLILLIVVDLFGKTKMGAQRWLSFGILNFQPSEFSKVVVIFLLARFFSSQESKYFFKGFFLPLILITLNAFLIFKQPDLGTALILIFIFILMGTFSHIRKRYIIFLIILGICLSPFVWHNLKDYQKKRLMVFLNPELEPLGAGYTIIQSKIAIGSGRIFGKGFLGGTQNQFNFLPERHTDFIFTVIAEEWGLIGCLILLSIYFFLIFKIISFIDIITEPFARLLIIGISIFLFLHIFINIGMTLGILPVVGIPLIFISYGGTHLFMSFWIMGVLFNILQKC